MKVEYNIYQYTEEHDGVIYYTLLLGISPESIRVPNPDRTELFIANVEIGGLYGGDAVEFLVKRIHRNQSSQINSWWFKDEFSEDFEICSPMFDFLTDLLRRYTSRKYGKKWNVDKSIMTINRYYVPLEV